MMVFGWLFMLAAFVLSIAALAGLVSPGWFARFSKTGKVYNRFVLFLGLNVASVVAMFYGAAIMSAASFSAAIGGVLVLSSLLLLICSVVGLVFPGLFTRFSKNGDGFSRQHLFLSFFCSALGSLFVGAFLLPPAPNTEAANNSPSSRAEVAASRPASVPAVGLMAAADAQPASSSAIAGAASTPTQNAMQQTAAASESSPAAGHTCRVTGIKDGDTFTCLTNGRRQITVRMAQIDAPEKGQPFGQKAKSTLSEYIHGQTVRLEESGFDRYGQTLAEVYDERGRNINMLMVQAGLAWAYKEYMTNTAYLDMQEEATRENRGLWSENGYIYPSDWRRGVRPQREQVAALPATEPQQRQRTGRLVQDRNARGFTCGSKRFCGQMNSCEEAMFYLRKCGVRRLDRDNDGIPCESLC